jgi:hypothetical protein
MYEFPDHVDHPALAATVPWAGEHRILLLGRPKSVNALGARGSRMAVSGQKKQWQQATAKLLMEAAPGARFGYVEAAAELRYDRELNRFDEDNFRSPIAKFLGDALDGGPPWRNAGGRWLPDDSSEFFRLRSVDYRVVRKVKGASTALFDEQRRMEAPSTLIVVKYLERCPHEFGPAKQTPEGPRRSLCALPREHVGECLSMSRARTAWQEPAAFGWREGVKP